MYTVHEMAIMLLGFLSYRIFIYVYVPHRKYATLGSIVVVCTISVPHRLSCLIPVSGAVWGMLWNL